MATNDFIVDIVQKMSEDSVEYVVIAVQKGKTDHKVNAYFNIISEEGANMILATADHIFQDEEVSPLLSEDLYTGAVEDMIIEDDDDSDSPNIEDVWPDHSEDDYKDGAD